MANPYTQPTLSGYNSNPPADDGSAVASNEVEWQKHLDKIGDPLKTFAQAVDTNVLAAIAKGFMNGVTAITVTAQTLTASHQGKLIAVNISGGGEITVPNAATVGTIFSLIVLNQEATDITVKSSGGTINGVAAATGITLSQNEWAVFVSDGTNWIAPVHNELSVAAASDTVAGTIEIAVQSEMEAASSATLATTPGRQHFHPASAKAWIRFDGSAGTIGTGDESYNMVAVTDNGTGDYTINFDTDFNAAGDYAFWAVAHHTPGNGAFVSYEAIAAGTLQINTLSDAEAAVDATEVCVLAFGDHA